MKKHFASSCIRVEKNVVTRIIRVLGGKGSFCVRVGQLVAPAEIIGSAYVSAGFRTLNLSDMLSVPPRDVERYLTRPLGQRIYKDELLAYKKGGLFGGKKVVTSPTDGVLELLNDKTGELKVAFAPKKTDLPAGVYGIVEMVNTEKGEVVIRAMVSRIHGICGSGRLRDGILRILGRCDSLIQKEALRAKYEEYILVGGSLLYKDAISAAISAGVNGIITGGINAEDYRGMASGRLIFPKKLDNDIGISIVVCEGFGPVPIGDDIFSLLSEYDGKFVFIDGNKAIVNLASPAESSLLKVKSTALPPVDSELISKGNDLELKVGLRVRVVGNYYFGQQGILRFLDDSLTLLPSGIKTSLATVETASRKIQVPVANLEIVV